MSSYNRDLQGTAKVATADASEYAYIARDPEYDEKMSSPEALLWLEAMNMEMETQHTMDTFEEVARPPGVNVIGCRWVYVEKRGPDGTLLLHKARLVAKGFSECEGIDYKETFAPTLCKSELLLLIAIAIHFDWEISHIDVKGAFLHGHLEETIYMEAPAGYPTSTPGGCWKLKRSIYRLKQVAWCWYTHLQMELEKSGFRATSAPCIFVTEGRAIASHVDDMINLAKTKVLHDCTKSDLSNSLKLHDLGNISFYLGMKFTRDRAHRTIKIAQD